MKKKIFALLLSCVLCLLCLTGCTATTRAVTDPEITDVLTAQAKETILTLTSMTDEDIATAKALMAPTGRTPDAVTLSGVNSWDSNKDELTGDLTINGIEIIENFSNSIYVAVGDLSFGEQACEFRMTFSYQLETESITFNPIHTLGYKMKNAAMNTVIGIFTVFCVLILIMLIIYCFKYIHAWEEKMNSASAAPAVKTAAPAPAPAPVAEEEEDLSDDLELVAVITAAIAASEGTSPNGLTVRSIRRTGKSNWKRA